MNKAFWSRFKHFGRLLVKMYLFLTPSKTDGRVPSQQGAATTCNLSYREVSQQKCVQTLLASLGVVIGQNSAPQWGWGGGGLRAKFTPTVGGGERGYWKYQIAAILDTKSRISRHHHQVELAQTPWMVCFPATLSFQGHIIFPDLPASKKFVWRKDILRNRSIGCPCICLICCFVIVFCKQIEKEQCREEYLREHLALTLSP